MPFSDEVTPSDAELRIAQAQLVGWLEGLFHGIQTALFAQQMAARAQLEQMRQGRCRRYGVPGAQGTATTAPGSIYRTVRAHRWQAFRLYAESPCQ